VVEMLEADAEADADADADADEQVGFALVSARKR
jgi:hypothetical protein